MTGADKHSVRPRLEIRRVSQATNVLPHVEEGLLGRVLGKMRVSQDAVRHPVQAVMVIDHQRLECAGVPPSCVRNDVLVHRTTFLAVRRS